MLNDSLRPPLELIFEWQTSKFPHGIRRGNQLIVLIGVFLPICLLAVVLRTRVRVRRRNFGIDDGLIIFAMLFATGVDTCLILAFHRYGYDRHAWDLTQPMALQARQCILAIELLNSTSTCFTKVSILFFYRRLGRGTYTTTFLIVVQTNIVLIALYLFSFSIVLVLSCRPVAAYWLQFSLVWTSQHPDFRCLNEAATTIAANAVSIAQDLVACGLPSVLLWKLQMGRSKKILFGALLGLGILPCIAGLLRLLYTVPVYTGYDATWSAHPVLVWTAVETHLGILCACAPALHSYGKEALDKAPPWLRCRGRGRVSGWCLCAGPLTFFRYLTSGRTTGTGSGSGSGSGASFFRRVEKRGDGRGAGGGHVELDEGVGNSGGGGGGGRNGSGGGRAGSGSGSDGSTGGRKGKRDSGVSRRSGGTLLSSLSTLDEAGPERSMAAAAAAAAGTGAAVDGDDGDLERGLFARSESHDTVGDEGGGWDSDGLQQLPERVPAAYLGPYRQQQRDFHEDYRWQVEGAAPLSTAGGSVSQEEIGVAITTDPPTVSGLFYDRRRDEGTGADRS